MDYKRLVKIVDGTSQVSDEVIQYCKQLCGGIESGSRVIKEVLEKYFSWDTKWGKECRVRIEPDTEFRNCRITGLSVSQASGRVRLSVYWQSGSTDGEEGMWLSDLLRTDEYIIPATDRHDRLRVQREWLDECYKEVARELLELEGVAATEYEARLGSGVSGKLNNVTEKKVWSAVNAALDGVANVRRTWFTYKGDGGFEVTYVTERHARLSLEFKKAGTAYGYEVFTCFGSWPNEENHSRGYGHGDDSSQYIIASDINAIASVLKHEVQEFGREAKRRKAKK